jgi:5-methyltetrahydropteroyltriglutamate--homocysteine methyltransferase
VPRPAHGVKRQETKVTDVVRQDPPFRAEHIGSMLRPRALKDAHRALSSGTSTEAEFDAVRDQSMIDAIRLQEEAGMQSITDGEFRRASWFSAFFEALEGFSHAESLFQFRDAEGGRHSWTTCCATAPIRRTGGITTGEFDFIRAHTDRTPKVTMPTPSALHFFRGKDCVDAAIYPDLDKFWNDVVTVFRAEIADLVARGATYLQLDEVPLAMLCDPLVRDQARAQGEDPEALIETYIDVLNRALEDRPADMRVGIHLCRGNFRGRWMAEGGYEPVAERLFNHLAVDAFFLEFDNPRSGDFSPLRLVPADKTVVLGLVSSKSAELEAVEDLRRRIDAAATHVPLDRLCLSPQCGFASVAGGNLITEDDERAKLRLVSEVAEAVWGSA